MAVPMKTEEKEFHVCSCGMKQEKKNKNITSRT